MAELQEAADRALGLAGGDVLAMIGIGHIGAGRGEEGDLVALRALGRRHEEWDVVFAGSGLVAVARADVQCVWAAWQVRRDLDPHRRLPAGVVKVVMMEMDGSVMLGPERPAMFGAVPVMTRHGTGRQVHEVAVMLAGADIECPGGRDVDGEIPAGDTSEGGRIDFAVEVLAYRSV